MNVASALAASASPARAGPAREPMLSAAWRRFSESGAAPASTNGRELIPTVSGAFVLLWRRADDGFMALAASPAFQAREWFTRMPADVDPRVRVGLVAPQGSLVWGSEPGHDRAAAERRAPTAGDLAWSAVAHEVTPGALAADARPRRRVLVAALVLVVAVILAGGYVVSRAVSRELAAARLQADFVAAVSHEFRTPLTSLRQFSDLLNGSPEPDEAKRRSFHAAQARATDRLQRLVESLLDFGRMEAGARPYDLSPTPVAPWVRSVAEEFRRDALPPDFSLDVTVEDAAGQIEADRDALAFALWNLLDNAVKYSGDSRRIAVRVSIDDGRVRVAVRDEGLGIPPAEQRHVFDRFVRGEASRQLGIRGTGLGLAIVSRIVAAHGGRIDLASAEGAGSTFTIVLPQAQGPAAAGAGSAAQEAGSIHGAHSYR